MKDLLKTSIRSGRGFTLLLSLGLLAFSLAHAAEAPAPRERLLLDFGWKFHLGNDWGTGAEPGQGRLEPRPGQHDLQRRELAHRRTCRTTGRSSCRSTGRPTARTASSRSARVSRRTASAGIAARSSCRKEDAGRRLWLEFDGVFRDCPVFVNGWFVGHHESGYSSFRYDITDVANCGGRNVVAVRVDASQFEGWFYEGAGIYRHVWLVKTAPLAIAPDGDVRLSARFKDNVPGGPADDSHSKRG